MEERQQESHTLSAHSDTGQRRPLPQAPTTAPLTLPSLSQKGFSIHSTSSCCYLSLGKSGASPSSSVNWGLRKSIPHRMRKRNGLRQSHSSCWINCSHPGCPQQGEVQQKYKKTFHKMQNEETSSLETPRLYHGQTGGERQGTER